MFDPLFAAENSLPALSYPWWITNALVPAGISVLGSLLTMLSALLVAHRAGLSMWEPYSRELWSVRLSLYREACLTAATAARVAYNRAYNWDNADSDKRGELQRAYDDAKAGLDRIAIQTKILLSSQFIEVFSQFQHQVYTLASESTPAERYKHSDSVRDLQGELLQTARDDLNVGRLGDKALTIVLSGIKDTQSPAPK